MMSELDIPWLNLNHTAGLPVSAGLNDMTDEDADGSLDGDDVEVREALDSMVIDEVSGSITRGKAVGDLLFPKRKRTLSQASPPKVSDFFAFLHSYIKVYFRMMVAEVHTSVARMVGHMLSDPYPLSSLLQTFKNLGLFRLLWSRHYR
jgi:hypothetical protein